MDGCSPYLTLPVRTEAQATAERQAVAERAELYERMLGYDEARAAYIARCSWHQRRGHYHRYLDEQPSWAPLPHTQEVIAQHTLHPEASAEFWTIAADVLCDWLPIASDLVDSAPTNGDRISAEYDERKLKERIARARDYVRVLMLENDRLSAGAR